MKFRFIFICFSAISMTCASIRMPNYSIFKAPITKTDDEYSIFSFSSDADTKRMKERDMLYDAYNSLHSLAQVHNSDSILLVSFNTIFRNFKNRLIHLQ
jgi:hypothetical protein